MRRRHWQPPPPAGGRAGRRRATAQALQQVQPLILGTHGLSVDQGGYLVFTEPRRLRLLQKTQFSKLEKFETFNDINVPLS